MCLTLPKKIVRIDKGIIHLADGSKAKAAFFEKAVAGDWVLVNADLAVAKVTADQAGEIKELLNIK